MTDQLDGRDLDRAVAEAMGWTAIVDGFYKGELLGRKPGCEEDGYLLPLYSTDPRTQAEKLAWFRSQGLLVCHWGVDDSGLDEWTVETEDGKVVTTRFVKRDLWDLALARLIVVVAKAKKEQGK